MSSGNNTAALAIHENFRDIQTRSEQRTRAPRVERKARLPSRSAEHNYGPAPSENPVTSLPHPESGTLKSTRVKSSVDQRRHRAHTESSHSKEVEHGTEDRHIQPQVYTNLLQPKKSRVSELPNVQSPSRQQGTTPRSAATTPSLISDSSGARTARTDSPRSGLRRKQSKVGLRSEPAVMQEHQAKDDTFKAIDDPFPGSVLGITMPSRFARPKHKIQTEAPPPMAKHITRHEARSNMSTPLKVQTAVQKKASSATPSLSLIHI